MHRAHAVYVQSGGDESALISRYSGLIDRIARRLASRTGIPVGDLWSVGALGLLEAARRFDASRDIRFESFAEHRIRGAMLDELRRMDHLPRRLRSETEKLAKARQRLSQALGREMTSDELAAELGLNLEELGELELMTLPVMPLDPNLPAASHAPRQDDELSRAELVKALSDAVAALPQRLQTVLSLHYIEGLTYREIAGILEVSEPRVCQLHSEAVGKLRASLSDG
jgi:RNA polymerase sigma factor for flagellar operon FliA